MAITSRVSHVVPAALLALAVAQAASASTPYSLQLLSPVDTATSTTYTSSLGTEYSTLVGINASGEVLGSTTVYDGLGTAQGYVSWVDSAANPTPVLIGLTDANHTHTSSGNVLSNNTPKAINASRLAIGTATAYLANGTSIGSDVWIYNPANTASPSTLIDPTTMTGTASTYSFFSTTNTTRTTNAIAINASGIVGGTSAIYSAASNIGTVAWLYNSGNASLVQVGVTPQSIGSGGRVSTTLVGVSDNGIAIGQATRYVSSTSTSTIGTDGWYYNANAATPSTVTLGLTGNAWNTNTATYSYSPNLTTYSNITYPNLAYSYTSGGNTTLFTNPTFVSSNGYIAGTSSRYNGTTSALGNDAWVFNPSTNHYTVIGLNGPGYDLSTTSHTETLNGINSSGSVIGSTNRFASNGTGLGTDGWVYENGTTTVLSLTGGVYNSATAANYHYTNVSKINALGEVAGYSSRYNGTLTAGQDAWVYDPTANNGTGSTFIIQLSVNPVNGLTATSGITYLSDTGVALGYYNKYNSNGTYVQEAFAWSDSTTNGVTTGTAVDLNLQVPNLAVENWANLFNSYAADPNGLLYGYGIRSTDAAGNTPSSSSSEVFAAIPYHIGDATEDGKVDLSDLNVVLNHLGQTSANWTDGNFDGAPTIDLTDLNDVLNNLGTTYLTGAAVAASPVPEPTSLAILALGGALTLQRRKGPAMARNG